MGAAVQNERKLQFRYDICRVRGSVYTGMQPKLKRNTELTKNHIVRTWILPYFNNKKMGDIHPKNIMQ